jgi:hypothetical protein
MQKAVIFGLMLLALAACEAGQTGSGSLASGESIEQDAAAATLPN